MHSYPPNALITPKIHHMKTICNCLAIFFTLSCTNSLAQDNAYFNNNPEWHILMDTYSANDCTGYRDSYNYYLNGDTTMNAQIYKKVYKKGIKSQRNSNCQLFNPTPYRDTKPAFCLRSSGKKMFLIMANSTNEELLYDFNLTIGDTLPKTYTYNPGNSNYVMYVTAIDSIYTENGYLKRFALNKKDTLFEGIGSTGGLNESIFPLFLSGQHELICYGLNHIPYVHTKAGPCDLAVGVQSSKVEHTLSIFPNPFSEKTTLQFNKEMKNAILQIFDTNGSLIRTTRFSGSSFVIERKELKYGIYYYQVISDKTDRLSGKLVIGH
jgi:hypothetical protein